MSEHFPGNTHGDAPPRSRSRAGFTLIELLVVMAIIALLVAILLPSLAGARRQARVMTCASNLRVCGHGISFYLQANKDVYCGSNWGSLIHKYVQRFTKGKRTSSFQTSSNAAHVEFYLCPDDEIYHGSSSVAVHDHGRCARVIYALSYGVNNSLLYEPKPGMLDDILSTDVPGVPDGAWGYYNIDNISAPACDGGINVIQAGMRKSSAVKRPSEVVMLMDAGDDDFGTAVWYFDPDRHDEGGLQVHHKNGNNFLYADYHVGFQKVLPEAYQQNVPPWPWAWIPLNGWTINKQTNKYNPYGQDYSQF